MAKDSSLPRSEMVKQTRPLVDKALELQPNLAEAHVAMAYADG